MDTKNYHAKREHLVKIVSAGNKLITWVEQVSTKRIPMTCNPVGAHLSKFRNLQTSNSHFLNFYTIYRTTAISCQPLGTRQATRNVLDARNLEERGLVPQWMPTSPPQKNTQTKYKKNPRTYTKRLRSCNTHRCFEKGVGNRKNKNLSYPKTMRKVFSAWEPSNVLKQPKNILKVFRSHFGNPQILPDQLFMGPSGTQTAALAN